VQVSSDISVFYSFQYSCLQCFDTHSLTSQSADEEQMSPVSNFPGFCAGKGIQPYKKKLITPRYQLGNQVIQVYM